jgi:hypothetical protein
MAFYDYPSGTKFGRIIPKDRIIEASKPSASVRKQFTSHVGRLIWAHKLAPETLNIPAGDTVSEVQVLSVALKADRLDDEVLRAIDKAIPHPIIFELTSGTKTKVRAAYKRPNEAGGDKWVVEAYFGTDWHKGEIERQKLPTAVNMDRLYDALLKPLVPIAPRKRETLPKQVARLADIEAVQKNITKLQGKLRREKQYKKKIVLNSELKAASRQLRALMGGGE